MSAPAHAERAHALLGASGASRWIACPPSARLTENIPDKRSEYADEGTAAHELSEVKLQQLLIPNNSARRKELETALAEAMASAYYGPEMENAVNDYVDIVAERFLAAKARSQDAVIMFEQRLDFSEWVPEGYGTGDVIIISDGIMDVIDLKYGKGVPVSAFGNPQMRLYALGAWQEYDYLYGIEEIHMTIVQPRLDSVSTDIVQVKDLLEWAGTVVKPAAALAFAGEGEFKAGEHCRWCKVKGNCRARADENMKALEYEFRDPALMTLEEIGSILFVAEQLQTWAKDVQDYAFEQAKSGNKIPLWKLVEGRSNRIITDKEAVKAKLIEAGYEESKLFKPQELLGISDLETKVVGSKKEFAMLVDGLIIKPPGKPVLVPETDHRAELNSVDQDFADEEF
ncbi:DUF2800 domain-containing protein [Paenibacillus woosongensis]|uniref:DUF2800 domain-containing protein n=1 Tax=Paenibacillus woosongensis TaxID=307580 RepID=A0ABQ4MQ88_9BACL|nr:DUF2800 domain-containing protein [Paenibacillus woosongensis]GIP57882.1 hypothetical protein J15TS10_16960 [Paenibacillus woosongensis]